MTKIFEKIYSSYQKNLFSRFKTKTKIKFLNIITMTSAPDSWKEWFLSRDSASHINKNNLSDLLKTFNHSLTSDQCKSKLQVYNESVFLFCQNFGEDKLGMFHHFNTIGGTLYSKKEEVAFIQGIGENTSSTMTINCKKLTEIPNNLNQSVPTQTNMLAISSIDNI